MTYKFRGISTITNKWVYGSLLQREDAFGPLSLIEVQHKFPHEPELVHVIKETVGMWTGLKDIEGNDIYGGDIVLTQKRYKGYGKARKWKRFYGEVIYVICESNREAEWFVKVPDDEGYDHLHFGPFYDCKVISTIHEAPHLLNPASGQSGVNHMNNIDPNEQKQQEEVAAGQTEPTNDQVQATEQQAQEDALESAEEGTTEG